MDSIFLKKDNLYISVLKELENYKISSTKESNISKDILSLNSSEPFSNSDSIIIKGVNAVLWSGCSLNATDIHFEPYETTIRVRFRINGRLLEKFFFDISILNLIIGRIKFLANLDISEKRIPQDGRISCFYNKNKIDLRVSTLPTIWGEKIVIRILNKNKMNFSLNNIGFSQIEYEKIISCLKFSSGIILVSGPTGAGKSTTLYSLLNHINKPHINISTIENPVEYSISNVNQIQINPNVGLSFSGILRQLLRQDPDVIMIGEIRDFETAELAIKSAMTGHLIFSTLHTKDAVNSINRLRTLGIDNYLIANTVRLIISQRLLPTLCPECKIIDENFKENLNFLIKDCSYLHYKDLFFTSSKYGCSICNFSGFSGQTIISELLEINNELRGLIESKRSMDEILNYLDSFNHKNLIFSGINKAKEGVISLDSIISVL